MKLILPMLFCLISSFIPLRHVASNRRLRRIATQHTPRIPHRSCAIMILFISMCVAADPNFLLSDHRQIHRRHRRTMLRIHTSKVSRKVGHRTRIFLYFSQKCILFIWMSQLSIIMWIPYHVIKRLEYSMKIHFKCTRCPAEIVSADTIDEIGNILDERFRGICM